MGGNLIQTNTRSEPLGNSKNKKYISVRSSSFANGKKTETISIFLNFPMYYVNPESYKFGYSNFYLTYLKEEDIFVFTCSSDSKITSIELFN